MNTMQIKVKFGREWWLFPTDKGFTKKELDLFRDIPIIAPLEMGETVKFFTMNKKKYVKQLISKIAVSYIQGFSPVLKDGTIISWKVRKPKSNRTIK